MTPQVLAQEQEMQQQAQFQQMQMQQRSISLAQIAVSRRRRMAQRFLQKAEFRRNRASEHDDGYFGALFAFASVVDGADLFDAVIGFVIMLFTFWVPWLIRALFMWGPRHYVWEGDTGTILLGISQVAIKLTPWGRALPLNSFCVMVHWLASIEHKENDLLMAHIYERTAKKLLKRKR